MRKYYLIPLIFFFLAAALGLFLRWQFVIATPGIRYTYFLHGHSHVMFLGWVFNVLFLGFAEYNLQGGTKFLMRTFLVLQVLVVAMMISFPIQGYGVYSIIFSTLHTIVVLCLIPFFFRRTRGDKRVSTWFALIAWLFFALSTAGPFALGYLMANDLGKTVWYNFAIYYYLHFQYNGFFLFGVFSLLFQILESKQIDFSRERALNFGKWTAVACVPAYALSILFARPGAVFNIIGAAAATMQLAALWYFARDFTDITDALRERTRPFVRMLLSLAVISLILKAVLQLASAHPQIAEMAYSFRPVIIAYLHLVLVGVISILLLAWYIDRAFVRYTASRVSVWVLLAGFVGSELCLVLLPWWSQILPQLHPGACIFIFSALMLGGIAMFLFSFRRATPQSGAG